MGRNEFRAPEEVAGNVSPSNRRPTLDQAKAAATEIGILADKADEWWHAREASGWLKGMAGGGTAPVGANWRADLKTYATRGSGLHPPPGTGAGNTGHPGKNRPVPLPWEADAAGGGKTTTLLVRALPWD